MIAHLLWSICDRLLILSFNHYRAPSLNNIIFGLQRYRLLWWPNYAVLADLFLFIYIHHIAHKNTHNSRLQPLIKYSTDDDDNTSKPIRYNVYYASFHIKNTTLAHTIHILAGEFQSTIVYSIANVITKLKI